MSAKRCFRVEYDHEVHAEAHSVEGAREALRTLFDGRMPNSVLDVGCGTGTWLKAALELGASEVLGVEGADLPAELLAVPKNRVLQGNLSEPLDLARRFDLVLCLEVAEHLDAGSAGTLVDSLVAHGDRILFSAAAPGQPGTHHVNRQWPDYWQRLFNARGSVCNDSVRWTIWQNDQIEPWYRQNLITAEKDEVRAGNEPRIAPVLHPEMIEQAAWQFLDANADAIERGVLPWRWYPSALVKAFAAKVGRRFLRA